VRLCASSIMPDEPRPSLPRFLFQPSTFGFHPRAFA
jgi:hypothetical protein